MTIRQTSGLGWARLRADRPAHLIRDGRTLCGHTVPKGIRPRKFTDQGQVDCYQCRRSKLFRYVDGVRVKIGNGMLTCLGCGFLLDAPHQGSQGVPELQGQDGPRDGEGRVLKRIHLAIYVFCIAVAAFGFGVIVGVAAGTAACPIPTHLQLPGGL